MAVRLFPYLPESNHPQYLWNEQEYIIRMLNQNANGIAITNSTNSVTISLANTESQNFISHGSIDFANNELTATFSTLTTRWIYLRADGSELYESSHRPEYNQYLHGHYRNGDRAVVFINSSLPWNQRAVVMDSFNSHFQYDQTVPTTEGTLIWEINSFRNQLG